MNSNGFLVKVSDFNGDILYEVERNNYGIIIKYNDWDGNWYDRLYMNFDCLYDFNEIFVIVEVDSIDSMQTKFSESHPLMRFGGSYKFHLKFKTSNMQLISNVERSIIKVNFYFIMDNAIITFSNNASIGLYNTGEKSIIIGDIEDRVVYSIMSSFSTCSVLLK